MFNIIPAIDLLQGQCVRLTKGDFSTKKIYSSQPLEVAKSFEDAGIERLHLVDLDGAKAKQIINYKVLEKIANNTNLKIDFGGGIKTEKDLKIAFNSGAKQITVGSIAASDPSIVNRWIESYKSEKIILGADVKDQHIAINAWQDSSVLKLMPFLEDYITKGIQYCICTDVAKDGLLEGSSIQLYKSILKQFPNLKLIASGGVSSMQEIKVLEQIGCYGVIIGKAIYEGRITLKELEKLIISC